MKSMRLLPFLIFSGMASMGITGCDETKDIQNWADNASKLRGSMEDLIPKTPYRKQQHEAFKGYFSDLGQMALALKNDEKLRARFNEAASKSDLNSFCQKVFTQRTRWEQLVHSCTKNRFFLCAEEVRAYPEQVHGLRGALSPELQRRFDQTPSCRLAF